MNPSIWADGGVPVGIGPLPARGSTVSPLPLEVYIVSFRVGGDRGEIQGKPNTGIERRLDQTGSERRLIDCSREGPNGAGGIGLVLTPGDNLPVIRRRGIQVSGVIRRVYAVFDSDGWRIGGAEVDCVGIVVAGG